MIAAGLHPAAAQHLSFRMYNEENGLSNDAITSLAQDREGFLYAGTESGLYRYDGLRFRHLGPEDGLPLSGVVEAVRAAADGRIWVVFADRVYLLGSNKVVSAALELVADDDYGQNAAVLGNDLLLVRNAHLLRVHPTSNPEPGHALLVQPFLADAATGRNPDPSAAHAPDFDTVYVENNRVWFGCAGHVCRLDNGNITVIGAAYGLPEDRWTALLRDHSGTLWLRSPKRIASLPAGARQFSIVDVPGGSGSYTHDAKLLYLIEDAAGHIVTQSEHGLLVHENGKWSVRSFDQSPPFGSVDAMLLDREGSLWLGSYGHSLVRLTGFGLFESWTQAQGLADDVTWNASRDGAGRMWVANSSGVDVLPVGLDKVPAGNPASNQHYPGRTYALATSAAGHLWIGQQDGRLIRRDAMTGREQIVREMGNILTMAVDPQGPIWIGTKTGLARIRRPDDIALPVVSLIPEVRDHVFAITFDKSGELWVLSGKTLLHRDRLEHWHTVLQIDPARGYTTHTFAFAADGSLWLGSFVNGITRLHLDHDVVVARDQIISDRLQSQEIEMLHDDHDGRIWIGTERGLDVTDGHQWRHFDIQDGLIANDINDNAVFADIDRTLWFGASGGLSHLIDPDGLFRPVHLHPVITDIRLESAKFASQAPRADLTHLHWTGDPLVIRFTALNFTYDRSIRFRYRMRGVDRNWVDTTEREARYTNPPSGRLVFEIMAIESTHGLQSDPIQIIIKMHPAWWKTWPAYGAAAIAMLIGLTLLWRLRIGYLLVRQRQLESMVAARTLEIEEARRILFKQATYDSLTGLLNRRAVMERLRLALEGASRTGTSLAVVMLDLDHFKHVNDTYGHLGGDAVLTEIGRRLILNSRQGDEVGRYGGEEILALLPGLQHGASDRIEILRAQLFEAAVCFEGNDIEVTGSMGVAWMRPEDDVTSILMRADASLYDAKRYGRNQVVFDLDTSVAHRPGPTGPSSGRSRQGVSEAG